MRFDENCEIFVKSPGNSTTPILHNVNMQTSHKAYRSFGVTECAQKHTYYEIDSIDMLPYFGTAAQ